MDAALPIVRVVTSRSDGDCVIVALAMYLGLSYEDVLAAAADVIGPNVHHEGMWTKQIVKTAKTLGTGLTKKRKWDIETSNGILVLFNAKEDTHVVLLCQGMIIDCDGTIWEPDVYFSYSKYNPTLLLTHK